jgi:hypothetical protein
MDVTRHFLVATKSGRYAHCGKCESAIEPVTPLGIKPMGEWLHHLCGGDWHEARQTKAVEILSATGIAISGCEA